MSNRRRARVRRSPRGASGVPPLVFMPADWPGEGHAARRLWMAEVRRFAAENDLDAFALMHPESAANLLSAHPERVRRSIEFALNHHRKEAPR